MKKVLFFLIAVFLFAQDIVDIYRFEGSRAVSEVLEKTIQNKKYWLQRLKNIDVTYGYYEKAKNVLVCVKKSKKLEVYNAENGKFDLIDTIDVLTGLDGDKKKEGDLKTPVGVYKLIDKLTSVDKFYGPFAFATSYPNLFDRLQNKNGHGIWIHGLPLNGQRDSNNTKGCIVMKNDRLEKLANEINYKNSFLLIGEDSVLKATKDEIARILAFLYKWRYAWKKSDFDIYKTFYSEDFKRSDGKNLSEFLNYKKKVFNSKKNQNIKIFFKNINIIPYQNVNNHKIFRIDMYEIYKSKNYTYRGNKELYIRINGDIKILVEK